MVVFSHDGLLTWQIVLFEYEKMRACIPNLLQKELMQQLRTFDAPRIFAEIASFEQKALDNAQTRLVQVVTVLVK